MFASKCLFLLSDFCILIFIHFTENNHSFPSLPSAPSLPLPPIHLPSTSPYVLPWGVNKAWNIKLRQDRAPTPASRLSNGCSKKYGITCKEHIPDPQPLQSCFQLYSIL